MYRQAVPYFVSRAPSESLPLQASFSATTTARSTSITAKRQSLAAGPERSADSCPQLGQRNGNLNLAVLEAFERGAERSLRTSFVQTTCADG